ncbi:MAG: radical SAM protein [Pseudomonadota bacterium]|nr:radical SAM protein [Pseudomonadota bacterium]
MRKSTNQFGKQSLRVAFIHAPDPIYADTQNYGAKFMPVWAYTLGAHIPGDGRFDLSLHDCRFEPERDIAEADIFLFSGINQDCGNLERVRADLKRRFSDALSIIGGPICWSFDQAGSLAQLDGFDHIFIGDGEDEIADILEKVRLGEPLERVRRVNKRFQITNARPFYRPMLDSTVGRYYGAVLEVSRGCPFLCEFCDIRVLPDNNRAHNKSADLIVSELDHLCRLGVQQVLFACDNFIGEPRWAEEVIDKILEWQQRTGFRPSLYTWLTVNLYKLDFLMTKMRRAGFDMLFIGVESFSRNSLLETAKVQNSVTDMVEVIRKIQSYGFIVVAGLIFGFDSDDETCFDATLTGLKKSALLSGDPSLLTALPGTPLYRRMKLSDRLRQVRFGLGGYKYQTNITYLLPTDVIIDGYKRFVTGFCDGAYQYGRLKDFFDLLGQGNFVPMDGQGFGNLWLFLRMILGNRAALWQMTQRLARFLVRPSNLYYALKGLGLALSHLDIKGRFGYFQFWLFAWTNAVLKYQNISASDFDIDSVGAEFDIGRILPNDYATTADEDIPVQKINAQLRATVSQLESVVAERSA